MSGALHPGREITVRSVAALLGIGVTPARDALLTLCHEGLVEVHPRGTVVRTWTQEEMRAHYQLRLGVERQALQWAADHMSPALHRQLIGLCDLQEEMTRRGESQRRIEADRRFHELLISAAHNKEIARIAGLLRSLGPMVPTTDQYPLEELLLVVQDHRDIANALLAGQVDLASGVLEQHLERPLTHLQKCCVGEMAVALSQGGGIAPTG
jgi:DNA-binding GntR family transcriptional regulator